MKRPHKYILLPLAELTGAMRTQILARLKDYGRNQNALFKQDNIDSIAIYKRKSNGARYVLLSFLQKPAFIPARFQEIAVDFDKIRNRVEISNFIRGDIFEHPKLPGQ